MPRPSLHLHQFSGENSKIFLENQISRGLEWRTAEEFSRNHVGLWVGGEWEKGKIEKCQTWWREEKAEVGEEFVGSVQLQPYKNLWVFDGGLEDEEDGSVPPAQVSCGGSSSVWTLGDEMGGVMPLVLSSYVVDFLSRFGIFHLDMFEYWNCCLLRILKGRKLLMHTVTVCYKHLSILSFCFIYIYIWNV